MQELSSARSALGWSATGAAGDRNAILLHGDFQCRLGVAACGATPAPFVVTSAGEIEPRRFGTPLHGIGFRISIEVARNVARYGMG